MTRDVVLAACCQMMRRWRSQTREPILNGVEENEGARHVHVGRKKKRNLVRGQQ